MSRQRSRQGTTERIAGSRERLRQTVTRIIPGAQAEVKARGQPGEQHAEVEAGSRKEDNRN